MKMLQKTYSTQSVKTARKLPENWRKVAGMLRGRRSALEKHVNAVRREWR